MGLEPSRCWGDTPEAAVNLKLFLDGSDDYWVTSVTVGDKPHSYHCHIRSGRRLRSKNSRRSSKRDDRLAVRPAFLILLFFSRKERRK